MQMRYQDPNRSVSPYRHLEAPPVEAAQNGVLDRANLTPFLRQKSSNTLLRPTSKPPGANQAPPVPTSGSDGKKHAIHLPVNNNEKSSQSEEVDKEILVNINCPLRLILNYIRDTVGLDDTSKQHAKLVWQPLLEN
ncbi:unnamed protein product [Xylocopa violacea]|uniref:Uncharacterized protein n=1 Tax=Xylocopa violacea TaxID=135666 RepID=A0ABP1N327_XYLVO